MQGVEQENQLQFVKPFVTETCLMSRTTSPVVASPVTESRYAYYRAEAFFHSMNPASFIACVVGLAIVGIIELSALPHCRPFYSVRQLLSNEYISRGPYLLNETFPTYTLAFVALLPILVVYAPMIYLMRFKFGQDPTEHDAVGAPPILSSDQTREEKSADCLGSVTSNTVAVPIDPPSNTRRIRFTKKQFAIATAVLWALVQCEAIVLTLIITDASKYYAGNYRPDFLNRLQHEGYLPSAPANELISQDTTSSSQAMKDFQSAAISLFPYLCPASSEDPLPTGYIANDTLVNALQQNKVLKDGRLSFPSGHSSISFTSMVPLSLFLAVELLEPWKHRCVARLAVSCLPLLLAFTIAISRTRDQRHHFSDILAGSVIGAACALVAFLLNFTAIAHSPLRDGFCARDPLLAFHNAPNRTVSDHISTAAAHGAQSGVKLVTPSLDLQPPTSQFRKLYCKLFPDEPLS